MVKYLIRRPIAVFMSFLVLLMAGILVAGKVPVSLLPNIDVPQMVIRVNYPNASAMVFEQNIVRPIREGLLTMDKLKHIETQSAIHTALLHLHFDYKAKMNLVFVNVNEQLDQLMAAMPRDMPRPQVMRVNTSDIPVVRIQVVPKENTSFTEVSSLVQKTLKKRLEQLEGVSLVDINGLQQVMLAIIPDQEALEALGLTEKDLLQPIQLTNHNLGSLSIKDGQYRYLVKLVNLPENETAISNLPITLKDGTAIPLKRVAKVVQEPETQRGYHLFNGKEALVLTVQKRPGSRMNELVPQIERLINLFRTDYNQVEFSITQDQTFLLDAGIDNLKQDLFMAAC
nr:efflux RND transporter permease subunit [Paraflavitalea speifideiaquila]